MEDAEVALAQCEAALAEHLDGMVLGFAVVVERLMDDGRTTLSLLHTPMSAWHLTGMLTYAEDEAHTPLVLVDEDDDLPD